MSRRFTMDRAALFGMNQPALFQHTGSQPFLNKTHDTPVRDPVLDEFLQPCLLEEIEESAYVGTLGKPFYFLVLAATVNKTANTIDVPNIVVS